MLWEWLFATCFSFVVKDAAHGIKGGKVSKEKKTETHKNNDGTKSALIAWMTEYVAANEAFFSAAWQKAGKQASIAEHELE